MQTVVRIGDPHARRLDSGASLHAIKFLAFIDAQGAGLFARNRPDFGPPNDRADSGVMIASAAAAQTALLACECQQRAFIRSSDAEL